MGCVLEVPRAGKSFGMVKVDLAGEAIDSCVLAPQTPGSIVS